MRLNHFTYKWNNFIPYRNPSIRQKDCLSYYFVYSSLAEIRDRSLVMGRRLQSGRGAVKFYPYKKGDRKSFSHAEGEGSQKVLG